MDYSNSPNPHLASTGGNSPNSPTSATGKVASDATGLGNNINTHNPAQNKADLDVAYLKAKKIPALLESLAAEFIVHKPHDPESYLKNRFHVGSEGGLDGGGETGIVSISKLCPLSAIVKMAASRCALKMQLKELDSTTSPMATSSSSNPSGANANNGGSSISKLMASSSNAASNKLLFADATVPASPFGKTPCLEHNGLVLLEVGPVVRYLCHGTPYLPSTLRPRMKVEVAFDVIVANILPHALVAVNEKYVIPKTTSRPVDNASIQQAASRFRSDLVQMIQRGGASSSQFFSESVWVAGREPSIADMALAAGLFAIQSVGGYDAIMGLATVEKWWDAVRGEQWYVKGLADWQTIAASLHSR